MITTNLEQPKVNRVWAMPSVWTFECEPIRKLVLKYVKDGINWVDPFAGKSTFAEFRNDAEQPQPNAMDALEFLKTQPTSKRKGVIFDPPYSTEQCLRRYKAKVNGTMGREEYWAKCKDEIARIIQPDGFCLSFCWNSVGLGKVRNFRLAEVLLVCHGAGHNDTICTVERKDSTVNLLDICSTQIENKTVKVDNEPKLCGQCPEYWREDCDCERAENAINGGSS